MKHVIFALLILYVMFTLLLLFGFNSNGKSSMLTIVENYRESNIRNNMMTYDNYSTTIMEEEYTVTEFEIGTQIPGD